MVSEIGPSVIGSMADKIPKFNVSGVYAIFCDANDRYYVGGSKNIRGRLQQHVAALRTGRHHNPHISYSHEKYGEHSFLMALLEKCENDKILEREQHWIDALAGHGSFNIRKDSAGRPGMPSDKMILAARSKFNRKNLISFHLVSPDGTHHRGKNLAQFCREKNLPQSNIWSLVAGKVMMAHGWRVFNGRDRKSNAWSISKAFRFVSPSGDIHEGKNMNEFARKHGLTQTSLCQVMKGKQTNHKGWRKAP